jgi:parvulin-like peptidyl-prolyl isomerase
MNRRKTPRSDRHIELPICFRTYGSTPVANHLLIYRERRPLNETLTRRIRRFTPMPMRKIISVIPVIILLAFMLHCTKAPGSNEATFPRAKEQEGIAATVNGEPITWTEIDRIIAEENQRNGTGSTSEEASKFRLTVLDTAIERELLFQHARKEGLFPSEDEITSYLNDKKLQSGMSEEQYQNRLTETGSTNDDLRSDALKSMAIQRLQQKLDGTLKVSDKDIDDYYANHATRFVTPRGIGLATIVISAGNNGASRGLTGSASAKLKIDGIYNRLKTGSDFATVARAVSEDKNSNRQGGDIGFYSEDDLRKRGFPDGLIRNLFALKVGDITTPVYNEGLWCIFKLNIKNVTTQKPALDTPGVRTQIIKTLLQERKGAADRALLEQEKSAARIVRSANPAQQTSVTGK